MKKLCQKGELPAPASLSDPTAITFLITEKG